MTTQSGLIEYKLEYGDRNGVTEMTSFEADARRIQNVLFGHGRVGDYDLGVDIQSYLFEISDSKTIQEIDDKIRTQVAKYCPDTNILELVVETLDESNDPSGRANMSLVIGFSIGNNTGFTYEFAIVARKDFSGTVVSKLII